VEGAGGGLVWAKQAESEGGMDFFFFFKLIFKASFKLNFEQIFFYKKFTHHKIKVLQHECIKKFSKLILNFNFPKIIIIFLY